MLSFSAVVFFFPLRVIVVYLRPDPNEDGRSENDSFYANVASRRDLSHLILPHMHSMHKSMHKNGTLL